MPTDNQSWRRQHGPAENRNGRVAERASTDANSLVGSFWPKSKHALQTSGLFAAVWRGRRLHPEGDHTCANGYIAAITAP